MGLTPNQGTGTPFLQFFKPVQDDVDSWALGFFQVGPLLGSWHDDSVNITALVGSNRLDVLIVDYATMIRLQLPD